jgi:hypothetical protein
MKSLLGIPSVESCGKGGKRRGDVQRMRGGLRGSDWTAWDEENEEEEREREEAEITRRNEEGKCRTK